MLVTRHSVVWMASVGIALASSSSAAQEPVSPVSSASTAPAGPARQDVVSRDPSGSVTLRAVRLSEPLQIDGRLEESLYQSVPPVTDFIQVEPEEGSPATERTDVWIAFDDDNFYVSFRNWETEPDRVVAKEMRRDHTSIWSGDDIVAFFIDTFFESAKRLRVRIELDWRPAGRADGERAPVAWRLEHDLGFQHREVRGRMDGGDGDSV